MEKLLQLYKFVDGVNDTPFPNATQQATLYEFRYDAKRMGNVPTISGTIMHPLCLDNLWGNDLVYVVYNKERYFLKQTPTSAYSNEDTKYKHECDFVSERIVLNDVYFYDVVASDTTNDKPVSNGSNVTFFGDIHEFAQRLNYSLQYAKVGYSVVVDEGISSEAKMISFQDQFFANALQEIYNTYEIPYYFVGKVIHIGFTNNAITRTFKYGVDDALLSITKTNANYKVVNRVTGIGSSDNIPYYYPNKYESREQVEAEGGTWIPPQTNLMPPIYRESLGDERFYNALNKTYINPQTNDYYEFANPYQDGKPKEQIVSFEDIKPSIVGITNASGARIDMFSEFAYDSNDNDETDEEGNYLHPYFFAKLRKFDGQFGFNLFDHAIDEDEMVISMTSGSCGACNFVIGVDSETQKNTVQVDTNGNLLRDKDGNILFGSPQDRQNDTSKYEVWIALRKDIDTFGVIMPNATNNYKPNIGDTFVILHIDLPQSYISAAENRLKEEIIKYMAMNNSEKFTFSIAFSRIFFAQNPDILAQLNENARLQIEYNNKTYELYVSSYSYNVTDDSALPEIRVELSDTLTIAQNALQTAISEVKTDIMNSVGSIDWLRLGLKYFLRKDTNDRSKGKVASDVGFEVGKFVSGASGAIVYVDKTTGQTIAELDKLYVRMKAYFETLEIINVNSVGGKQLISPAGSIRCIDVKDREVDASGNEIVWDYYRCYFLSEQDGEKIENRFVVGDQAYCQLFNAQSGVTNNISNKYYWRLIVGVGENYINLSKSDCDNGSDAPAIGDVICHRGNRNDVDRQNVIEFSSVDSFSPSITLYQGIDSYSLNGKDIVSFGVDKTTNKAFMNVYGDMYVGDRNNTSYMRYTQENGLELKGRLAIGTTLSDGRELEQAIKDAAPEGYDEFVEQVTKEFEAIRNEMDGAIDTWFGEEVPTLNNYPAVDWVTNTDKDSHLGDLFYTNDGKAFRFQYTEANGYYWATIDDSEVVKALELAQKALDTADGKRRVFIEQPYPPYDLGDLWAGGEDSPLKRCVKAKGENGSYAASDWALADDSHAYSDAIKQELEEAIATTTSSLNTAIQNAEKAANEYTDTAKEAIQDTIDELNKAKANIEEVYTKSQADDEISRAEQAAIDAANEAAAAAILLSEETVKAYADGVVDIEEEARIKQAEENLDAAKKYAEEKADEAFNDAKTLIDGYEYLRRALGESTTVDGGLIQSALLMLGYTENDVFKVMSGTNGLYDSTKLGGGIAAWYGGPMADKEADNTLVAFAQSLFRFDGSGYLAGGNITWDKDGAGQVAGGDISWDKNGVITLGQSIKISGDTNETLSSILSFINEYRSLWTYDAEHNAVRTALNLIVDESVSFGGVGTGGGGTGGVTALSALTDVALGTLSDGQALVWDANAIDANGLKGAWVNKNISGGLAQVTVKLGTVSYTSDGGVVSLPAYPSALSQLSNDAGYIKPVNNTISLPKTTIDTNFIIGKGTSALATLFLTNAGATIDYAHIFVSNADESRKDRPLVLQYGYGNVGIGVAQPAYKLEVNGSFNAVSAYVGGKALLTAETAANTYLPLSGGTIEGVFGALTIKRTDVFASGITFSNNNGVLGSIGYDDDSVAKIWDVSGLIKYRLIHSGGGTIEGDFGIFKIKRSNAYASAIEYSNKNGVLGYIGYNDDYTAKIWDKNMSNPYTLIHSGNIGDYALPLSYMSLTPTVESNLPYAGGLDSGIAFTKDFTKWKTFIGSYQDDNNTWQNLISVRHRNGINDGADYGMYIKTTLVSNGNLVWNKQIGASKGWQGERTLLDSGNIGSYNAGSATKLQTARTIWGQSFDGTGDVSGDIVMNGSSVLSQSSATSELQLGGGIAKTATTAIYGTKVSLYSWAGGSKFHSLILNENGNVLIGTTEDKWGKLQVYGNSVWIGRFATDKTQVAIANPDGGGLAIDSALSNTGNALLNIRYGQTNLGSSGTTALLVKDNGNIIVGTSDDNGYKMSVLSGDFRIMEVRRNVSEPNYGAVITFNTKRDFLGDIGWNQAGDFNIREVNNAKLIEGGIDKGLAINTTLSVSWDLKVGAILYANEVRPQTHNTYSIGAEGTAYHRVIANYFYSGNSNNLWLQAASGYATNFQVGGTTVGTWNASLLTVNTPLKTLSTITSQQLSTSGDSNVSHLNVKAVYATVDYIHLYVTGGTNNARPLVLQHNYGNVVIGTPTGTSDAKLYVAGNFVATGAITFGSDSRYKHRLDDVSISLEDIANAPLFNYVWTDREDKKVHLGTTAQYWNNTNFRNAVCPTTDEKLWTMSYSEIAMGNTIVIARELIPIKSDVQILKERVNKLESILTQHNIKFD